MPTKYIVIGKLFRERLSRGFNYAIELKQQGQLQAFSFTKCSYIRASVRRCNVWPRVVIPSLCSKQKRTIRESAWRFTAVFNTITRLLSSDGRHFKVKLKIEYKVIFQLKTCREVYAWTRCLSLTTKRAAVNGWPHSDTGIIASPVQIYFSWPEMKD